jgi:hypothetical protein
MQFRPQGKRIQVLAYRGYDKEKKRASVKLLGSFGKYDYDMSDGLIDSLTDDEKTELQSHIDSIRQSDDALVRRSNVRRIASHIKSVSDSLADPEYASLMTADHAGEVYASVMALTKALRKLGFKRLAKVQPTVSEAPIPVTE